MLDHRVPAQSSTLRSVILSRSTSRAPLLWLNLICLDAPLVAFAWQWMFGSTFHLPAAIGHRVALFLTTWLIYLADRFADAISLRPTEPKSLRQQFCLRHWKTWIGLVLLVGVLDGTVIFRGVNRETILAGAVVGALAIVYLLVNHAHSGLWEFLPLKEFSIAVLFVAGTLLGLVPHPFAARSTIILAAILFGALCLLNCFSIAIWERDLDRIQGKHSIATRRIPADIFGQVVFAALLIGCVFLVTRDQQAWPLAASIAASALFLKALPGAQVSRDERTALADLVLFTPLVLLLAERLL